MCPEQPPSTMESRLWSCKWCSFIKNVQEGLAELLTPTERWEVSGASPESPPPFHHCCPRSLQRGNYSNAGEQMCQRHDLCVFYWLCPSVNTVACFLQDVFFWFRDKHVRMPEETYRKERRRTDGEMKERIGV